MSYKEQIERIEQQAVAKQRAAGHTVERPACYSPREFDAKGRQLPATDVEMRRVAAARASRAEHSDASLFESYVQPTQRWPGGKAALIEQRVKHATGYLSPKLIRAIERVDTQDEGPDLRKLPVALVFALYTSGLMAKPPSGVTRAALAVFHPLALYSLLSVDPPIEPRSASPPPPKVTPAIARRDLRAYRELLPVLRENGGRVLDADLQEQVLSTHEQMLEARVVSSLTEAERRRRAKKRRSDLIPARETGWTTSAVEFRRGKLAKLVDGLRVAEPRAWPLSRIVALLLASSDDWRLPPCPGLVDGYHQRIEALEDLLKKDLARTRSAGSGGT